MQWTKLRSISDEHRKSNNKYTKSISSLLIDSNHQSDAVIIIIY